MANKRESRNVVGDLQRLRTLIAFQHRTVNNIVVLIKQFHAMRYCLCVCYLYLLTLNTNTMK